ncbi:hypothetical protein CKN94_10595 [Carnobacterium maltaromaticum]|nr:hypothetical protein CKN94_10595 [Carnobacterium maltaromaticum]TFJ77945.1 hypothetical protein CKN97_09905 [Carnobacterium maltaromaticum]CAD5902957.1 conserved hypothetical protein [Carnobacterium maltaromaticum]
MILIKIGDKSYSPIKNGNQTSIQLPKSSIDSEHIRLGSSIEFQYVPFLETVPNLFATVTNVELWDDGYWYMVYFKLN